MSRCYLFPDAEPAVKLSQRLVEGLVHGNDALPQFADQSIKVLLVALRSENGTPQEISWSHGSIWHFDDEGKIHAALVDGAMEVMNFIALRENPSTVVELAPRLQRKRFEERNRWEPSKVELDIVAKDIWPKSKSDKLRAAKGISKRRPPLTFEARRALSDASEPFFQIGLAIDRLKQPGLKSFAFEARTRAKDNPEHAHLFNALAAMADHRAETLKRRKSGKGIWYAHVELTRWDEHRMGESFASYYERCEGRHAAEVAARRMLLEHASKFAADVTVDAEVMTDIEWKTLRPFAVDEEAHG